MFLEICMQIYSVVFALSRQLNKQKVCEKIIALVQVIKFFCKISSSRGVNPKPPPLDMTPSNTECRRSATIRSWNRYDQQFSLTCTWSRIPGFWEPFRLAEARSLCQCRPWRSVWETNTWLFSVSWDSHTKQVKHFVGRPRLELTRQNRTQLELNV